MEKISKYKNSRIDSIDHGYSQVGFLAQLELIKNEKNKIKYGLKQCIVKLFRIDEVNTSKLDKRKIKIKRDPDFVYF